MGTVNTKSVAPGIGVNFEIVTLDDLFDRTVSSVSATAVSFVDDKSNSTVLGGTGFVGTVVAGEITSVTAGTVTSVKILENGILALDASKLSIDAVSLYNAWKADPLAPAYELFLKGDDTITGTAFDDLLLGGDGKDTLIGGLGADILKGGAGDDTYGVDNAGDVVDETGKDGTDLVQSSVSFDLSNSLHAKGDIENLTLTGSLTINGTGNALANVIIGNGKDNVIEGKDGADTLDGGAGIDTLSYASSLSGVTITLNGATAMTGTGGDAQGDNYKNFENITGSAQADILTGDKLGNIIDGGGGADQMAGGLGNDTYIVDDSNDAITELAGGGIDTVRAKTGWSLLSLPEIENLTLLDDAGKADATGNALKNTLTGNSFDNILDGKADADVMLGGKGHDTYLVDNVGDKVTELLNEGTDTIQIAAGFLATKGVVTYSLSGLPSVENLTYLGSNIFVGTGNDLKNALTGSGGNDRLDGGKGGDALRGDGGGDTYIVDDAGDTVDESVPAVDDGATDAVLASVSFSLVDGGGQTKGLVESLTLTGSLNINGTGNALANVIIGNGKDNVIEGKDGADTLDGGVGIDTLSYASSLSGVTITLNGATAMTGTGGDAQGDSYKNFENITGSAQADTLTGDKLGNIIDGGGGADQMAGGLGNDTYIVDDSNDAITEITGGGIDTVRAKTGWSLLSLPEIENLTLLEDAGKADATGNALKNTLTGNSFDNILDGKTDADAMLGGKGHDTYLVDNVGDKVTELLNEGTDTIQIAAGFLATKGVVTYSLSGLPSVENLTYLGSNIFVGTGNDLKNALTGSGGNDRLDGGKGGDALRGDGGGDTYIVDDAGDTVDESVPAVDDGATDAVLASVSFSLVDGGGQTKGLVESLTLTGSLNINGTGNALANVIIGNGKDNVIEGKDGADTLDGGVGIDTLSYASSLSGVTITLNGATAMTGTGGDAQGDSYKNFENITGSAQADILTGDKLGNIIDGGGGADQMAGGLGNDTYIVDDSNDAITELTGGGIDTVRASASFKLAGELENLTLTGSGAIDGTGNGLNNLINGNEGKNALSGDAGIDTLKGLGGNDTLKGGLGDDILEGGEGNDVLIGGTGADKLTGGNGADTFAYEAGSDSSALAGKFDSKNGDTITVFTSVFDSANTAEQDKIELSGVVKSIGHDLTFTGSTASAFGIWTTTTTSTLVNIDTTGDAIADMVIKIATKETLSANDFYQDNTGPAAPTVSLTSDTGSSGTDKITKNGALTVTPAEPGGTIQYSVNGGTSWSNIFTAAEGANTVLVRQLDGTGNNGASTAYTFTLDTMAPAAPQLVIDYIPGSGMSFQIQSEGPLIEYSFDAGVTWSGNFNLAQGQNDVLFRGTDIAGNVSSSSSYSIDFDSIGPAAPTVVLNEDTGSSASDGITKNGTLTVTPAEPGGQVQYHFGDFGWIDASVGNQILVTQQGANTVYVRQLDGSFNSSQETSISFTLDTVAPEAGQLDFANLTDSGTLGDGKTNDNSFDLSLSGHEVGTTVTYQLSSNNGVSWTTTTASLSGLADGNYLFQAVVTDKAGNSSTTAPPIPITIDATAPTSGTLSFSNLTDSGTLGDSKTNDNSFDLSLSGQEGGTTVTYQVSSNNGASWSNTTANQSGLSDGNYLFQAIVTDAAGNSSTGMAIPITIDTTPPAAPTVALLSDTGSSNNDHVTSNGALKVTPAESGGSIEYLIDGDTNWSSSFSAVEGDNSLQVRQVDVVGNQGAATAFSFTLDTSGPQVSILLDPITNDNIVSLAESKGSVAVTGTVSGDVQDGDQVTLTVNGAAYSGAVTSGAFSIEVAGTALVADSDLTVDASILLVDASGNSATASDAQTYGLSDVGVAVDGYVAGATVFADADDDGTLDVGEVSTTTDAFGNFELIGGVGKLVLFGGTDISTGQSFTGVMSAPDGATTITPLTTLVVSVAAANGGNFGDAEDLVREVLGLGGLAGSLSDFDPVQGSLLQQSGAADALTAAIVLQNTIAQGAALLTGAGVSAEAAQSSIVSALVTQILNNPTQALDLSNASTVTSVLDAAADAQLVTLDPATISGAADVIGGVNSVAETANAGTTDPVELLTTLAQLQVVVQTDLTQALSDAGLNDDPTDVVNDFTGTALETAVDDAASQVGSIAGNSITGTTGDDVPLNGTTGSETLYALDGNDTLIGGQGDDTLVGGAGVDTYVWNAGDGYDTISSSGAANEDVIKINGTFYDYNWEIDGNDLLVGAVADDSYTWAGNLRIQNFFAGGDSVAYMELDVTDEFQPYPDHRFYLSAVNGTAQGDHYEMVFGTSAGETMTGGGGGQGVDRLYGYGGNDTLSVSNGTRGILIGGDGDDTLTGADQDDNLRAGDGTDILNGGAGYDQVAYRDKHSSTAAVTQGVFVNLSGVAATYDYNGSVGVTVQAGKAIDNWGNTDTLNSIERAEGSQLADVLVGNSDYNVLHGNNGDDILVGGGNDGQDHDYLYGGGGSDSFVFGPETGETHIEDFVVGQDVLRFTGGVSIASLVEDDWGPPWGLTTTLTLSSGATVVLVSVSGVTVQDLVPAAIAGTTSAETVKGTSFDDTLIGGQGDDTLVGGAGVDTYVWNAGDGYDTISSSGAANEDVIKINGTFYDYNWEIDGNDLLVGAVADDSYTWAGNLRIQNFFAGGDSVAYMELDVTDEFQPYPDHRFYLSAVNGTAQGDHYEMVFGTSAGETMTGGGGGQGVDRLYGYGGNDTLSVSNGTRGILIGGDGDDTLTGADQDDNLRAGDGTDILNGGAGYDQVAYRDKHSSTAAVTQGVFVNLSGVAATYDYNGSVGVTVQAGKAIDNWGNTDTLNSIERAEGSQLADVLVGNSDYNVLHGNNGDDILVGGGNDGQDHDYLYGGGGSDSFVFGPETGETHIEDFVVGQDVLRFTGGVSIASLVEDDWGPPWGLTTTLTLSSGATVVLVSVSGVTVQDLVPAAIAGTTSAETVKGTSFDDTLIGGQGDDTLVGGAGVDTYVWNAGDGYDTISSSGAANEDVIKINGTFYDYNWEIDGNDLLVGAVADDSYTWAGNLRIQNFFAGGDSVAYMELDVTDEFQPYPDHRFYLSAVNGTAQGDHYEMVFGTSAGETMTGGGGGQGVDRLYGYGGNDTLSVSNGTRGILIGGDGDDTLTGADQDDNLRAGDGTDILNGGAGYDQVAYRDKHSSTAAVTQGVFVNLSGVAATYDYNGSVGVTVQAGKAIDNWGNTDTLNSIERAEGSQLADVLVGNSDYNVLHGNNGDDILVGGGNDGQDHDYLYGGGGSDSFVFGPETGETHIEDFVVGQDVLRFTGGVSIASLVEDDWGPPWGLTTTLTLSSGATVVLVSVSGVTVQDLVPAAIAGTTSAETVKGTSFDDTLIGGQGDDTLVGGAGVDTYVWNAGDGYDTISSSGAANEDVIKINGTFYDYNWEIDGNDLLVGAVADDSYTWAGNLRIQNFFAGGDSVAYMELDVTDEFQPYPDHRFYLSAVNGTAQGDHYEMVFGTSAGETMTGGGGGQGVDRLYGYGGNDTLSVSNGTRGILIGGDGDDTLTGADQDDNLRAGDGTDILNGGAGYDQVAYRDKHSSTAAVTQGVFVNLSGVAATYDYNGSVGVTVQAGKAIDNWGNTDTLNSIERAEGSQLADVLVGNSDYNVLHGNNGDDILVGGGNDGQDHDYLYGGGGSDSFVFGPETGETHIEDFVVGQDGIQLVSGVTILSLQEVDFDNVVGVESTEVALSSGATVVLIGVVGVVDSNDLLS